MNKSKIKLLLLGGKLNKKNNIIAELIKTIAPNQDAASKVKNPGQGYKNAEVDIEGLV